MRITVQVTNRPPTFNEGPDTTRNFAENTAADRNIGDPVAATDNETLTYSLMGTRAASFETDSSTGQLRTKQGVTYGYETEARLLGDAESGRRQRRQ